MVGGGWIRSEQLDHQVLQIDRLEIHAHRRVGGTERQRIDERPVVQTRTADNHRWSPASGERCEHMSPCGLESGDRELLFWLGDVDEVMR